MTIGVGVEGPSDRDFWKQVLHKYFPSVKFDIRNMNGKTKLIGNAPRLLETFRGAHYTAGFLLMDADGPPICTIKHIQDFDTTIQQEARKPMDQRFLFVCIAFREMESWFLADDTAINMLLPKASYSAPAETGGQSIKALKALWRQQYHNRHLDKIDFAKSIAPIFNPNIAEQHSASFKYFWQKVTSKANV